MKKPSTGLNMLRVSATKKQLKPIYFTPPCSYIYIYTVIIQKNSVILAMFFQNIFLSFTKPKTTVKLWDWDVYHSRVGLDVGGATTVCFKPPMIRNSKGLTFVLLGGGHSNIFDFHPYLWKWSNLTFAYFSDGLVKNHQAVFVSTKKIQQAKAPTQKVRWEYT